MNTLVWLGDTVKGSNHYYYLLSHYYVLDSIWHLVYFIPLILTAFQSTSMLALYMKEQNLSEFY